MKENLGTVIPDWIIDRMDAAADPKAEGKAIAIEVIEQLSCKSLASAAST